MELKSLIDGRFGAQSFGTGQWCLVSEQFLDPSTAISFLTPLFSIRQFARQMAILL